MYTVESYIEPCGIEIVQRMVCRYDIDNEKTYMEEHKILHPTEKDKHVI